MHTEYAVVNAGMVPSGLTVLQGFLICLHFFLLVSLEFASKQLPSGMAVWWHAFFELDLCPNYTVNSLETSSWIHCPISCLHPQGKGQHEMRSEKEAEATSHEILEFMLNGVGCFLRAVESPWKRLSRGVTWCHLYFGKITLAAVWWTVWGKGIETRKTSLEAIS